LAAGGSPILRIIDPPSPIVLAPNPHQRTPRRSSLATATSTTGRRLCVGIAVTAALTAVGCGSSSGSGASGLSRAQIDASANKICEEATAQIRAVGALPADFRANPTSAAAYLDKVTPITDKAVAALSALTPSSSVKDRWNDFILKNRSAQQALDSARARAHARDPSGLADFEAATGRLSQKLDVAARTVGATGCAN